MNEGLLGWPRDQKSAPILQVTDGFTTVLRVKKIRIAGAVVSAPAPTTPGQDGGEADITISASLPTDFISGLALSWVSTTQFQVGTGSAYVPSAGGLVTLSSPVAVTPTLAANTLYYVFLTSSGSITVSSTAPSSNYQGTAWKTAGGDRFIGSFLSSGGSLLLQFNHVGDHVFSGSNIAAAPAVVLSGGGATTPTSVSCTAVVPATARAAIAEIEVGTSIVAYFGVSTTSCGTSFGQQYMNPSTLNTAILPLTSSQAFYYCCSFSSAGVKVSIMGYLEER